MMVKEPCFFISQAPAAESPCNDTQAKKNLHYLDLERRLKNRFFAYAGEKNQVFFAW